MPWIDLPDSLNAERKTSGNGGGHEVSDRGRAHRTSERGSTEVASQTHALFVLEFQRIGYWVLVVERQMLGREFDTRYLDSKS